MQRLCLLEQVPFLDANASTYVTLPAVHREENMTAHFLANRLSRLTLTGFSASLLFIALLGLISGPVPSAHAANGWYVATSGDDHPTCGSVADPCKTINYAVGRASSGDTVYIAAGMYTENVVTLGKVLTFIGAGMGSTIVDGGGTDRVFNTATDITLANLTVQHGSGNDAQGGGGLHANGALTLTNVSVLSNTTVGHGGGALAYGAEMVSGCLFRNNTASTLASGGGLYGNSTVALADTQFISNTAGAGGGMRAVGAAMLSGGLFLQNNADYTAGGGLYTNDTLTLSGTQFISNTATTQGGGAYAFHEVTLLGGLFQNNTCTGLNDNGGGLSAYATLTLTGTQFINNTAGSGSGGGAFANYGATLSGGLFRDNRCTGANCVGGGLFTYGTLTLADTQIISNTSQGAGGGVYAHPDPAAAWLSGGLFQSNHTGGSGGGLYVDGPATIVSGTQFISNMATSNGGGLAANGTLILSSTQFISNLASASGGGAYAASAASLTSGLFQNNQGGSGGGLFTESRLALAGAQFIGNTSQSNGGGAPANGAATVSGSLFQDNTGTGAASVGGGLYEYDGLTLTTSRFINNAAAYGGGLFDRNFLNSGRVANALFARNSARISGSAIYMSGNTTIQFTTIASPTLGEGAAIYVNDGNANITNTIITRYITGVQQESGTVSEDYNLFYGNTADRAGTVSFGAHDVSGDPHFVNPAGDNYHLTACSAAIDRGQDVGVTTDQDGNPRPVGAGFDIGAYEYQSASGCVLKIYAIGDGVVTPTAGVYTYTYGTVVPLTATAHTGSILSSWSGDLSGSANPITLTLDSNKTVTATFTLSSTNQPPVANAGANQTVKSGALVTLDGSASFDPDSNLPLVYCWTQTGGASVVLSSAVISRPTFTAPGVITSTTLLTFTLMVTDSFGLPSAAPAQVDITVEPYRIFLPVVIK